jgi:16S rRNA (adenine1518-N6/adenine1519-N6)-dimethyltransferase
MSDAFELPVLDILSLLHQYGLQPDRRLGQNYLVDASALRRVAEAAEIAPTDEILEIGAGLGSLTRCLAVRAHQVIAIEIDRRLLPALEHVISRHKNVKIIPGDILELDPSNLMTEENYLVVANIPYYITSALIRHLLEARIKPKRIVLTIQREVAARICAEPGDMSLLALSVQVYGAPRVMASIPAGAFYPVPNVDSSVVRVDLFRAPLIPYPLLPVFFRLAKAGFSQKRKTLRNALSGGMAKPVEDIERWLDAAGIDAKRRAETLSIKEWGRLAEVFSPPQPQETTGKQTQQHTEEDAST